MRVTVGFRSDGAPGSYLLDTAVFTDSPDIDARSLIIETARTIQPAAPNFNRYTFQVGADPDPGEFVDYFHWATSRTRSTCRANMTVIPSP